MSRHRRWLRFRCAARPGLPEEPPGVSALPFARELAPELLAPFRQRPIHHRAVCADLAGPETRPPISLIR